MASSEAKDPTPQRDRPEVWLSARLVPFAVLSLVGCGENFVGNPPDGFQPSSTIDAIPVEGYPEGPYGPAEGDVLVNMSFDGYFTANPSAVRVSDLEFREGISFDEVRNLEGYSHMLLTVAAEWCKPCREEAVILPQLFDDWATRGGYVLSVMTQDIRYNTASRENIDDWARRYNTNYTMTFDANGDVASTLNPSTVPLNVVIELDSMTILRRRAGEDPDTFRFFEQLLRAR